MKKLIAIVTALFAVLALAAPAFAAAPALELSGPGTVRAGNTITISVYGNGTNIASFGGRIAYNADALTYKGDANHRSGWRVTVAKLADGSLSFTGIGTDSRVSSRQRLFTLSFTVKSGLAAGAAVNISLSSPAASDGTSDFTPSVKNYSVKLAAPLSANADLKSLSSSNATLSPAFSKNTLAYTATVPFSVSELNLSAATADSGAKAEVSSKKLSVGENKITITVTAASGAKKTYTLTVTRQQDPNYVPSGDAALSALVPSAGTISPAFSPDITEYILYLPFEAAGIKLTGTPRDPNASSDAPEAELAEGENLIKIIVTAENGDRREYSVLAVRMPSYTGGSGPAVTTPEETSADETAPETTPAETTAPGGPGSWTVRDELPFWTTVGVGILCLFLGFGICFLIMSRRGDY